MTSLLYRLRSALAESRHERADRRAVEALGHRVESLPSDLGADDAVDFLFSDAALPIQPWQYADELHALARLVAERRPQTLLEIGTADGGTLFAHARLAAPNALVISIDLPEGDFGGGYPPWRKPLYASFAQPDQRLELLRVDSHAESTADQLEAILSGRRLDYAFIDGDHTYDGVRQDFELCRRFAADDAIIAFHDIAVHPPETGCEVHTFWDEVKQRYDHDEFLHDERQDCYGIGVLYLGQPTDS